MIFIIKGFQTIVFIFIVISTMCRPICPPAFFRCLSNLVTFTELRTTSFIESTGVVCSDFISHNRVQVLSILVLLFPCSQDWTCNPKLLKRQSSGGCRFNSDGRQVTIQEYLTLVPSYGKRNQNRWPPWIQ